MPKIKTLKDGVEVEIDVAAVYETEQELQNAMRSENSKGKNEILKALGAASIEEVKAKMGDTNQAKAEADKLAAQVKEISAKLEAEQNLRYATELGIKPELAERVIILAKASMTEGKDFKAVLKAEADAIGAIKQVKLVGAGIPPIIGAPKTQEQIAFEKAQAEEMERLRKLDPMVRD